MKKHLILLAGILLPLAFFAQDTPLSGLFKKYADKPGYNATQIIPSQMTEKMGKKAEKETVHKILKKISAFRVISTDNEEGGSVEKLEKKISRAVSKADYKELVKVNAEDESIKMYGLKPDRGSMREFALVIKEEQELTLITLTGDVDMSDIFEGDIMDQLIKLHEKHKGKCHEKY